MGGVNRNELYQPSYPPSSDVNSKSNFTHYEEKLLANHSKSKKSIEVSKQHTAVPSQS